MNYDKHIEEFSKIAQEYCTWVETKESKANDAFYAQILLSKLYCWGIQLPDCETTDEFENDSIPLHDHSEVVKLFSDFPVSYYSQVFNAEIIPSEEPCIGDVIDDLADIYKDLKDGLWYLENTSTVDAVFQWRFSLGVHWARHALGAMYAMLCHEK